MLLAISLSIPAISLAVPPTYSVEFIGGFPRALNNHAQAVGWVLDSGISRGWVYRNGTRELLPVPSGWYSQANDINDNGVIVGFAGSDSVDTHPVIWRPDGTSYVMSDVPTPVTDDFATAVALNDFDDVVGYRQFYGEVRPGVTTQLTRGFHYSASGLLTEDLDTIGFYALPTDVNDSLQIVGGPYRTEQLSAVNDIGNYVTHINAINSSGQVAARVSQPTALDVFTASRYTDGLGWEQLTLGGTLDVGLAINDGGDVTYEFSASMAGVDLVGEGGFALVELVDDANWQFVGPAESDINNSRHILVLGDNGSTGQFGAVLLVPDTTPPPSPTAPDAPQNLAASITQSVDPAVNHTVNLTWTDASDDEIGFRVERRISGGAFALLANLGAGATAYNDNAVAFDTSYDYRVVAFNTAGDSAASNVVTANVPTAPEVAPVAPQGLMATLTLSADPAVNHTVTLSWIDASDNEDGFRVERRISGGGAFATLTSLPAGATSYDDSSVDFDTSYDYRVIAFNAVGDSDASDLVTIGVPAAAQEPEIVPSAPQSLSAQVIAGSDPLTVRLEWVDTADNEEGFRVERRLRGGSFVSIAEIVANTSSYDDQTVTSESSYQYRVIAFNSAGDSANSNMTKVNTPAAVPSAPANLAASVIEAGATQPTNIIQLTWADTSGDELGFSVERRLIGGHFSEVAVLGANTSSFTDDYVAFDNTYEYRVFAFNAEGYSASSNVVSVFSPPEPPPSATEPTPPQELAVTVLSAKGKQLTNIAQLSWIDASNNETGFRVERITGSGAWVVLTQLASGATAYEDASIEFDTTYSYRVFATNALGDSLSSNIVEIVSPPASNSVLKRSK